MEKIRKCLTVIVWKPEPSSETQKILLLKVRPTRGSFWQPVTGHVEKGEDFLDAALREAVEETGFSFAQAPQYLGLEYEFQGRFGPVQERGYALWIISPTPPKATLDPKEHTDFQWADPKKAIELVRFPSNQKAIERATQSVSPILLSKNGTWRQGGEEITHERTVQLLHESLHATAQGIFFVKIGAEEAPVVLEDTPRFVQSFDASSGEIRLLGGQMEKLKPETLQVEKENILYCTLENGWKAKFLSPAYYELSKNLKELNPGQYLLHLFGRDYEITIPH